MDSGGNCVADIRELDSRGRNHITDVGESNDGKVAPPMPGFCVL